MSDTNKKLFDNKVTLIHNFNLGEKERVVKSDSTALENSPVKAAIRSHLEKWYPELTKNKLEIDDMLETA